MMEQHDWQPSASPVHRACVRCPYPEQHPVHGWTPPEENPYKRVGGEDPFPGWSRTMTEEGKKITLTVREIAMTNNQIRVRGMIVYRSQQNDKVLSESIYDKPLAQFKETWI